MSDVGLSERADRERWESITPDNSPPIPTDVILVVRCMYGTPVPMREDRVMDDGTAREVLALVLGAPTDAGDQFCRCDDCQAWDAEHGF